MKYETILALDLGSTTGWAYRAIDGKITAGSWVLQKKQETAAAAKLRMDRKLDPRIPLLMRQLTMLWNANPGVGAHNPIDFLVFEDVQFSRYTKQTQLWSSFRTVVWLFCSHRGIMTDCCPVKTLKQFATGTGCADKDLMIEAAGKLFPGVTIVDDNCADALHLLNWAMRLTHKVK